MIPLHLDAITHEQKTIKEYLQKNASETLAGKINNGTPFVKDGKTLINRKTLDDFIRFACDEAKKQAAKGVRGACIADNTVFGWAIHYFEEDSIVGTLYNEDGTEYKPKPVKKTETLTATEPPPAPKPKPQLSFFDLLEQPENPTVAVKENALSQTQETVSEPKDQFVEANTPNELKQIDETTFVDGDGVVYPAFTEIEPVDPLSQKISALLDDKITVR